MSKIYSFAPTAIAIVFSAIIFYIIDRTTAPIGYYDKCKDINTQGTILFHHIIAIFAQFGWLSNNRYVLVSYLFIPIILITHWKTNENKCEITEKVRKRCGTLYFRDLLYFIGLKKHKYYNLMYSLYLSFFWLIALYKLYSNHL